MEQAHRATETTAVALAYGLGRRRSAERPLNHDPVHAIAATALDKKRLPYGSLYLAPSVAVASSLHAIDSTTVQLFLA